MKVVTELLDLIGGLVQKTSETHRATVLSRDASGTTWVHIPGGADETPINGDELAESMPGDQVRVTIEDGKASIDGNKTSPAVGQVVVERIVDPVSQMATKAYDEATRAHDAADEAEAEAVRAHTAADDAQASADAAQGSANDAATAAATANDSANSALANLSIVQDVAGTLQWIQDHCTFTATSDTEVDPSKVYFTLNQGQYEPVSNPTTAGLSSYYELTNVQESQAAFTMAHLAVTNAGLWVLPNGLTGGGYKVLLANNAMRIYDGSGNYVADYSGSAVTFYDGLGNAAANVVAYFGRDGSRIGRAWQSRVEIDYHSLRMVDSGGYTYMHVSDLRDADGLADLKNVYLGNGSSTLFSLQIPADSVTSVTVDGTAVSYTLLDAPVVRLNQAPSNGAKVVIAYRTSSWLAKAYTFGFRVEDSPIGPLSFVEGSYTEASGYTSHAEGNFTTASGTVSHSEGDGTTASGSYSHAEGRDTTASGSHSHAEGRDTTASNSCSHAEGIDTTASGLYSHAQNRGTIAAYDYQTAIGKYNDNKTANAFEVGNGSDSDHRSNAFEVSWAGVPKHYNLNGDFGTIFSLVYPVGSIYMSVNSTSPATLFGGTWERITGKFLLAATDNGSSGASQAAGNTGGEASHALTPSETATKNHSHTINHGHGNNISYSMEDAGGHTHKLIYQADKAANGTGRPVISTSGTTQGNPGTNSAGSHKHTLTKSGGVTDYSGSSGGQTEANGSAHNNMPPYLSVYVWKRTA